MSMQTTLEDLVAICRFMAAVQPSLPVALQLANLEDVVLADLKRYPGDGPMRTIPAAGMVAGIIMSAAGVDAITTSRLSSDFIMMLIRQS